ncbi:MAG: autoinducer binding domain-containing protein [Gammaproteobacteria bacterium]
MVRNFSNLVEDLTNSITVKDIRQIIVEYCEDMEFEHFVIAAILPLNSFSKPQLVHIGAFPPEWFTRYQTSGYLEIDPIVSYAVKYLAPRTWTDAWRIASNPEQFQNEEILFREAAEYGLASGIIVPTRSDHGPGITSFATQKQNPHTDKQLIAAIPHSTVLATYAHEAMRRVFATTEIPLADLTQREKETLTWAAEGKTAPEIGLILNVSDRTASFHLNNATRKLRASNRIQACARAVALGVITPARIWTS